MAKKKCTHTHSLFLSTIFLCFFFLDFLKNEDVYRFDSISGVLYVVILVAIAVVVIGIVVILLLSFSSSLLSSCACNKKQRQQQKH